MAKYYRQRKQVQRLTKTNFRKIEEDARVRFYDSCNVYADVQLIQLENPTQEAVVKVERGPEAGMYSVFTGNPKWVGHNGYTFEKAGEPAKASAPLVTFREYRPTGLMSAARSPDHRDFTARCNKEDIGQVWTRDGGQTWHFSVSSGLTRKHYNSFADKNPSRTLEEAQQKLRGRL